MACSNDAEPLQIPWKNVSITPDGYTVSRGIAVELGIPPQFFCLQPCISVNNTWVYNVRDCVSDSNVSCTVPLGGVYDPSKSTTFRQTTQYNWNGTEGPDVEQGGPYVFFNDDMFLGTNQTLYGFPIATDTDADSEVTEDPTSSIGLGYSSTFLKATVESRIAPSSIWSFWSGVRNIEEWVDGLMIIGGYDEARIAGNLTTFATNPECPLMISIADISYNTDNSSTSIFSNPSQVLTGCVDPYYHVLELPESMWSKFVNITGGLLNTTLATQNSGLITYPRNNRPSGNITITLSNGYQTVIPNLETFGFWHYWNSEGAYTVLEDSPWVASIVPSGSNSTATIGFPFTTMNYFIVDYERNKYHMALANRENFANNDQVQLLKTACTPASTTSASSSSTPTGALTAGAGAAHHHSNVGAIAGGVVGGVVGLALIVSFLVFFFWRRHRPEKQGSAPGKAELGGRARVKPPPSSITDTTTTEPSELATPAQKHLSQWLSASESDRVYEVEAIPTPRWAEMPPTSHRVEMPLKHDGGVEDSSGTAEAEKKLGGIVSEVS